ncbi:MAG: DUF885 domain-containing protein [Halieaceae bacterium]
MKRGLAALVVAGLLLTGWYAYRLVWGLPPDINHFADRSMILVSDQFPELITMIGVAENTLLDMHSDRLSDPSPAAQAKTVHLVEDILAQLEEYDRDSLRGQQALTYDYLAWSWSSRLAPYDYPYHFFNIIYAGPYPANQMSGAQDLPLSTLSQFQQVIDVDSAERFLARVAAIPAYMESLQAAIRQRAELGVVPPRVIMRRLIEQAQTMLATPAEQWSNYSSLQAQLTELDLDEQDAADLAARNLELIESRLVPAYAGYLDFLLALEVDAPTELGMWSLPDGLAYYQSLLRFYTTTDMTATEVHELGLRRVAEIRLQMDAALRELGYTEGDYTERLLAFTQSADAVWEDREGVRAEILAEYDRLNQGLKVATADAFRKLPPQLLEVRAVPKEEEVGSAGAYYRPAALDGSRPGIFFVNLRSPTDTQRFAMLTLAAHEGIPGHHFQTSAAQQVEDVPLVRNVDFIAAYGEGWALYTERLVYELGLHDSFSNIGRLQGEMFRAVRLVVDTGIHTRRWSRERAIDYMRDNTGMTEGEVIAEIERYIVMPGQACAYMIGMLEILALREEARARMGERFELADFHQAVLQNGALPLAVLRREVEATLR